jgi:hypothetical protein
MIWAGGITQAVRVHVLPKTLSSNPSSNKSKNKSLHIGRLKLQRRKAITDIQNTKYILLILGGGKIQSRRGMEEVSKALVLSYEARW